MAPIYDTDVSTERWEKDSWRTFEFWEKVEAKILRKKRTWIIATAFLFVALTSIPVIQDRLPKWRTLWVARRFSETISELKAQAAIDGQAFEIRFNETDPMALLIEKKKSCALDEAAISKTEYRIASHRASERISIIQNELAAKFGLSRTLTKLCYDPVLGAMGLPDESDAGFAFIPKEDIEFQRTDRVSVILLTGKSAQISFF